MKTALAKAFRGLEPEDFGPKTMGWGLDAIDPLAYPFALRGLIVPATDYVGTPGQDRIIGSRQSDTVDVSQGGNDSVACHEGDDTVYFGAAFTSDDRVVGGKGRDIVVLDGDYSTGLEITEKCLKSIESLELHGGSYVINGTLGYKDPLGRAFIDASGLGEGQTLDLDVASTAPLVVLGSHGDDVIRAASNGVDSFLSGLEGDDLLIGGAGKAWINADSGADRIIFGDGGGFALYGATSQSTRGSVDRIDNFAASGAQLELGFDSDTTKSGIQHDFHLGKTAERVGDILFAYDAAHDRTVVKVFTDHDNKADLILHLTGDVPLTPADFIFG